MDEQIGRLWEEVRQGDKEAFTKFYELTKKKVFYVAYSILRDHYLAEDIIQECYVTLLEKKKSVKPETVLAYLCKSAEHKSFNLLRKRRRESELGDIEISSSPSEYEDDHVTKVMEETLLPDEFRIVVLHVLDGFTHKEIAKQLRKPLGSVTWSYNNAIKKMQRRLENGY